MSNYLETLVEKMVADGVSEQDIKSVIKEVNGKKSPLHQNLEGLNPNKVPDDNINNITNQDESEKDVSDFNNEQTDIPDKKTVTNKVEETIEEPKLTDQQRCENEGKCWDEDRSVCNRCIKEDISEDEQEQKEAPEQQIETEEEFEDAFDLGDDSGYTKIQQDFLKTMEDDSIVESTQPIIPNQEGVEIEEQTIDGIVIPKHVDTSEESRIGEMESLSNILNKKQQGTNVDFSEEKELLDYLEQFPDFMKKKSLYFDERDGGNKFIEALGFKSGVPSNIEEAGTIVPRDEDRISTSWSEREVFVPKDKYEVNGSKS